MSNKNNNKLTSKDSPGGGSFFCSFTRRSLVKSEFLAIAEVVAPQRSIERPWKIVCALAPVSTTFPIFDPAVMPEEFAIGILLDRNGTDCSWINFL